MMGRRRRWSTEASVSMANVCLAGVLTGNEWGGWVAVHPALDKLPASSRLQAEQAVYRRYGRIMPFLMSSTVASGIAAASVRDGPSLEGRLTRAATGCYTAMLAINGNSGRDSISGNSGNDRITSRDSSRDRVNCGRGRDSVVADRRDIVSRNCERVRRR